MANAKVGVKAGWHSNYVETITAAKSLLPSDSGKLFNVTAGAFAITLPKATSDLVGFSCEFIISAGSNDAVTIDSYEADDLYYGGLVMVTAIAASTSNAVNGMFEAPDGSDDNTLTIDQNADHNGITTGSTVKFQCIAENQWWVSGIAMIHADEDDDTALAPFS